MRARRFVATALVVVVAAAIAVPVWRLRPADRVLVAHFTRVVGVHEGSDVRVLGVRVGRVVTVRPQGNTVRVEMRYDRDLRIPADALAIVVPPSVVSDRYIQLTPAYSGGAALADGADLPVARTSVPLEIDDIYRALDEFNVALGPTGANADGAVTDLLAAGRANLHGNGDNLNVTLDSLASALSTVADGRQDLFGTVANLQRFTTALARSDQQVREFNRQLADVATQLSGERDELAAALRGLAVALADVTTFVRDNRVALESNVDALADITTLLIRQQKAIAEILDVAPLAVNNLNLSYNARSGTLDTRNNALGPYDPAAFVCSLLVDAVPIPQIPRECTALAQTLNARGLPLTDQLRRLLGLPAGSPGGPGTSAQPGAATGPGAVPGVPGLPQLPADTGSGPLDGTLGGILRGTS
jgi:phospholipid/cholesterol/gamma-HCH transport system substrate-binding protein